MKKFKYLELDLRGMDKSEEILLGEQGWELVSVMHSASLNQTRYILKKEILPLVEDDGGCE